MHLESIYITTDFAKGTKKKQGWKVFWSTCVNSKAIKDTSSVLEFLQVWGQKEIPSCLHPITGLDSKSHSSKY